MGYYILHCVKQRFFLGVLLAASLAFTACSAAENDAARFKHEYEVLNGQTNLSGEHTYRTLSIPKKNPFVYVDGEEAKTLLTSESGIMFMGFPECPWCRTLLPALIAAVQESGYKGKVYYYNGLEDRDVLRLDEDGNIVTEDEGQPIYHELVKILYDHLGPYAALNDDSIRRIYFPTTVFFKDGVVMSAHLATVDSQEKGYDPLTDAQFTELKNELIAQCYSVIR